MFRSHNSRTAWVVTWTLPKMSQVGDLYQPDLLQDLSLLFHLQLVARLADHRALGLDVNGDGIIPGGGHPSDVLLFDRLPLGGEKAHLVGEANAGQGAP